MNNFISQSIPQPSVFLPPYTYKLSSAELITALFRKDLFTCQDVKFKTNKQKTKQKNKTKNELLSIIIFVL